MASSATDAELADGVEGDEIDVVGVTGPLVARPREYVEVLAVDDHAGVAPRALVARSHRHQPREAPVDAVP